MNVSNGDLSLGSAAGLILLAVWMALPMVLLAWRFFFSERTPWWHVVLAQLFIGWGLLAACGYLGLPVAYKEATDTSWQYMKHTAYWGWAFSLVLFGLYLIPYSFIVWMKNRFFAPEE